MRAPKPPGWLARVLAGVVLTQAALYLARPVTSYRALALGADARAVGLITAAFALVPLVVAVPLGRASDRWRPGWLLTGGIALGALACALLGLAGSLPGLALASAVLGLGHLALTLAGQSLIARQSGDDRHDRDFGLYAAAASAGQLIGPALAGIVLGAAGRSLEDATTTGFLVAAGLMALAVPTSLGTDRLGPAGRPRDRSEGRPLRAGELIGARGVPAGMFASLAILATVDVLTAYLPVLGTQRGIPPAVVGGLLSLRAAASILSRVLIPWMVGRLGRVRLLAASAAGSALLTAALPLAGGTAALAVLLAAAGFLLGIGQPLTMSMVVQAVPEGTRGTALAIRLTGNRFGQVATPAAAGLVAGAAGVSAAFFLLGGLLGLAAVAVVRR
ncbi:MAG TPA: MFS transporter [Actinomycetota bacterium]|nr:MFS transporter [Actinomycetota bacterium]